MEINKDLICTCNDSVESLTLDQPNYKRKLMILSTVSRTEQYLREHRILELIQFLVTKVLSQSPDNPTAYLESLLDDCMVFRLNHGIAPILYEDSHLKVVISSFDLSQRGWLSAGQFCRLFTTLGLTFDTTVFDDKIPNDVVLKMIRDKQEEELFNLVSAGVMEIDPNIVICDVCKGNVQP